MDKVILDTNVVISALISRGAPSFIIDGIVLEGFAELLISTDVLKEYREVIRREKFSSIPDFRLNSELLIGYLERLGTLVHPTTAVSVIKDEADNKFLELAVEGHADYLITGNTRDFTFGQFRNTKIVQPAEYWKEFINRK